jgi:hypothetical protein
MTPLTPHNDDPDMKATMSKTRFLLLSLAATVAISFGAILLFQFLLGGERDPDNPRPKRPYSEPWESPRSRAEIEAACREHVREADTKAAAAIKQHVARFSAFIQFRKPGAKPFSKDIVSFYGKWRVVKPYLPFTKSDGHKEHVIQKFNEHIFTKEQLAAAVKRIVEGSVKDLESIENELAVAVRQEILGQSLAPDEVPIAAEEFEKAIARLISASQWDAAKSAGSLVVSEVAAQVAAQVLVRLGVSAGILGTSAAASWWTFGSALVIGLVADVIWEWIDDPAGDIERELVKALDKLSKDASNAIEEEMNKVISRRSELWDMTVTEMLP